MYKIAITVITLLLLILANHPQAHAATNSDTTSSKIKSKLVTNPNKTESTLNTQALSYQSTAVGTTPSVTVYDVWFDMKKDTDGDGYYHQFDVSFDIDTNHNTQSIYVIAELNGVTNQTLFQTEPYTLYRNSGRDSYQSNILLTDGYPPYQYNLTLKIYDAENNELLLTYDAHDNSDLINLYLEDSNEESASSNRLSMYELTYELSEDYDGDGYYTELSIGFDADAPGTEQWVYARISLISASGNWQEISVSNDFLLRDYASSDTFSTQVNLNYGFDPNAYQLAIELYDADSHALLLTSTTPPNAPLNLESSDWDNSYGVIVVEESYGSGSGGGAGLLLITALITLLIIKRVNKSEK